MLLIFIDRYFCFGPNKVKCLAYITAFNVRLSLLIHSSSGDGLRPNRRVRRTWWRVFKELYVRRKPRTLHVVGTWKRWWVYYCNRQHNKRNKVRSSKQMLHQNRWWMSNNCFFLLSLDWSTLLLLELTVMFEGRQRRFIG